MPNFDPAHFGPVLGPLVDVDRRRSLGRGEPNEAMYAELDRLTVAGAFAHAQIVDDDMAQVCLAGVWLLHDFLDDSHSICQNIDTPSGSFWHAIMHRREGDFSNAKYWFRRVGEHPVFEPLAQQVLSQPVAAAALVLDGRWDPFLMVDACHAGSNFCFDVQQWEWELLFAHCYAEATG